MRSNRYLHLYSCFKWIQYVRNLPTYWWKSCTPSEFKLDFVALFFGWGPKILKNFGRILCIRQFKVSSQRLSKRKQLKGFTTFIQLAMWILLPHFFQNSIFLEMIKWWRTIFELGSLQESYDHGTYNVVKKFLRKKRMENGAKLECKTEH